MLHVWISKIFAESCFIEPVVSVVVLQVRDFTSLQPESEISGARFQWPTWISEICECIESYHCTSSTTGQMPPSLLFSKQQLMLPSRVSSAFRHTPFDLKRCVEATRKIKNVQNRHIQFFQVEFTNVECTFPLIDLLSLRCWCKFVCLYNLQNPRVI